MCLINYLEKYTYAMHFRTIFLAWQLIDPSFCLACRILREASTRSMVAWQLFARNSSVVSVRVMEGNHRIAATLLLPGLGRLVSIRRRRCWCYLRRPHGVYGTVLATSTAWFASDEFRAAENLGLRRVQKGCVVTGNTVSRGWMAGNGRRYHLIFSESGKSIFIVF